MNVGRAVVLLSGGVDSTHLAILGSAGSVALFIDWGQPALEQELTTVRETARRLAMPLRTVTARVGMGQMHVGIGAPGPRVIGGRNLMFCALGVAVACEVGVDEVWIGCSAVDQRDYPDCRHEFIEMLGALTRTTYSVRVKAPLLDVPRQISRDMTRGFTTWSCYEPRGDTPCGTCNGCRRA